MTARRTLRASARLADLIGDCPHQGVHQAEDNLDTEADEESKGAKRQRHALEPNRLVIGPEYAKQPAQGRAQHHAQATVDALPCLKRGRLDLPVYIAEDVDPGPEQA